ncbi:MAG: hypothetical protein RKO25_02170 [Candidatus Contendobacter sp.]|nr:hypothetical protein [Candidatus Contendobacter sp.]
MKQSIINIASIIFLVAATYGTYYYTSPESGLNWWGEIFPYGKFISTVLLMLIGIVFGCLFRQIKNKTGNISIFTELKIMWGSPSFWSAILVAPLVFGGVFFVGDENPANKTALFLAFQNGFFCESIFNTMFKTEHGRTD